MTDAITPRIDFRAEFTGLFRLDGQVVLLLPGGYGGIGEAIAWGTAMAGATVVICGRDQGKASALAGALVEAGFAADGMAIDCKSVAGIRATVDAAAQRHGRLDVLINCVGIQREQGIAEVTEEAFDEVYAVNLKAAMFLAQAVSRHQVAGLRGGRQVHLLSVRSALGLRARGYSAYCSTKGGLAMLIKQHAMELAPHGITVNGVAPTFVYTETDPACDGERQRWLPARSSRSHSARPDCRPEGCCRPGAFLCGPCLRLCDGAEICWSMAELPPISSLDHLSKPTK